MTVNENTALTEIRRTGMGRRDFLRYSVLGGAATYALSACGMSTPTPSSTGTGKTSLVAVFDREIISLDPHGASDVDEGTLLACRHLYDTLVVRKGQDFSPSLATKWEQPQPTTWIFTLREDVKFHDGSPLTADDVAASLTRLAKSTTPQAALWATLDKVTATDKKTVTVTTKEPLGTMLSNLTLMFVAPAAKLTDPAFFKAPIGSGPFKIESFTPSNHVNLVANTDYWGTKPKLQKLQFPYIPETSTRLTSLKTGEADVTWALPPDQLAALKSASDIQVLTADSYIYYFNWFNCSKAPFTDPRVRQAMWHAVDVKTVVSNLFGESAKVMDAPIPSTVFGYAAQQPYAYDPEKAKSLLKEAGQGSGFSTRLMWSTGIAPQIKSIAQAFSGYWSKIGVTVQLEELEQATWLKRLVALDWDMDLQNNSCTTGDADYTLGRLYTTKANRLGYSNKDLDTILAQARASSDEATRKQLYGQACAILWKDAVGIYPLQITATYGLRSSVQNFVPAPNNQPVFTEVTA